MRELIHSGRGGDVWLSADDEGESYVVKIAQDEEGAARLVREAEALGRLEHPRVVRLVAAGDLGGGGCIVTQRIDGASLAEVLRERRVTVAKALSWARQLCSALAHCHASGVVHRDVKASNVVVETGADGAERVILIDFGIALVDGAGEAPTRQGGLLGSVHTVSPELVRCQPLDGRADVYAVGVLLYRMLCGRYPFHARNPAEVVAAHAAQPAPPMGVNDPDLRIPVGLEALVMRCLSKDPDMRPEGAEALGEALASLQDQPQASWVGVSGVRASVERAVPAHDLHRPFRWLAGAFGIGALLTLAVGWALA